MEKIKDLLRFIGWFDSSDQAEPTYDPPHDAPCIVCMAPISADNVRTVSVLALSGEDDDLRISGTRSLFYRGHRTCLEALSEHDRGELDVAVMNAAPLLVATVVGSPPND